MYYSTTYQSPIGLCTLISVSNKLVALWIDGQKYQNEPMPEVIIKNDNLAIFVTTKKWLDRYFAGKNPSPLELSLAPIGSDFRQEVWKILCKIPYGEVISYGDIANQIATKMNKKKMSAQAVGGAVGHNPISIIIPCHRVVGSDGNMTGYSGGLAIKTSLLKLEEVDMSKLYIPKKGTAL